MKSYIIKAKIIKALQYKIIALAGFIFLLINNMQAKDEKDSPPNILIFIGDDIGWNDLGAYGHPDIRTPNIDRLADEGIKFNNAFLTTSQSSPSRASLLTGRYPHNTGGENLHEPLPADQLILPELLNDKGYFTASVGKWHLGNPFKSAKLTPSYDKFDIVKEGNAFEHGLKVLKSRPKNQPFFLWFASWDAHWPYKEGIIDTPHQTEDVLVPPFIPATPGVLKDFTRYYDEISRFDKHIGQVRKLLEKQGVFNNTLIIFLSDNGRPFPRSKSFLYDSGIKMPLIIRYPRLIEANTRCNALVSAIDIAPTVIELAGIQQPTTFQGKSMVPLLKDPYQTFRKAIYAEHNWHAYQAHERCVRTKDYLYIRNAFPELPGLVSRDYLWHSNGWKEIVRLYKSGELDEKYEFYFNITRPEEELYHLRSDPFQMNNVIDGKRYQSVADSMRQLLDKWIRQTNDSIPENPKKDQFDRWNGEKIK